MRLLLRCQIFDLASLLPKTIYLYLTSHRFYIAPPNLNITIYAFFFIISKVTGVNHKIEFPTPRAHILPLRLACPMSKPVLVTPHRAVPRGHMPCQVSRLTYITGACVHVFFIFSLVIASNMSSTFAILRIDWTVQFSVPVLFFYISILCLQKTGHSSYICWKDSSSSSQNLQRGV